jgi:hypothetical protein
MTAEEPFRPPSARFRVVDGGHSFRAEAVFAQGTTGTDYRTIGVWRFDQVLSVQGLVKPYPEAYDHIDAPLAVVAFIACNSCEYIFADPEEAGAAWLSYLERTRSVILRPNQLKDTMSTKPPSYLSQVFDGKFFTVVLSIVILAFLYTGSMLLFADWSSYRDPWSAEGSNRFVFLFALAILMVAFLVPAFKMDYVLARHTHATIDKAGVRLRAIFAAIIAGVIFGVVYFVTA